MPALPPAAQVLKVAWQISDASDLDVVTRLFFQYTGTAPTAAQLNTFATGCETAWTGNLQGLHTSDKELLLVTVEDLTSATAAVGSRVCTDVGTLAGNPLPAGTAALINWHISRRYRGGKPRSYFPLGDTTRIATGQTWTGAWITTVNTDIGNFITAIKALTWAGATIANQVNVSFYSGFTTSGGGAVRAKNHSTPRAGAAVVDVISSGSLNPRFGSQRRRNRP